MTDAPRMSSHRPYLLRALNEWICDNGMTPHLLVDATRPGVRVPAHTVNDGKVVLNIAARAVAHLNMDNDSVAFTARFGGVSHAVIVPIGAVLAIYARETGQGMALPEEAEGEERGDLGSSGDDGARPLLSAVPSETSQDGSPPDGDDDGDRGGPDGAGPRRGAHLRVVK